MSAVDGSILKSFMNKDISFKEGKRGSGMESVPPCPMRTDLLAKTRGVLFGQARGSAPVVGQVLSSSQCVINSVGLTP